ncbi:universal stress protein [Enterococcus faecalis]|nr:universal stress protein [Enterococcus faecalis]
MTGTYKNILVPIDGSEQSMHAVEEAAIIASRNGANIDIISVIYNSVFGIDVSVMDIIESQEQEYRKELFKKIEKLIPKEIKCNYTCIHGSKESIVEAVKKNNIDLIIIGATGKNVLQRTFVGSTTAYVVNHAPCNVLIVK